METNFNSIGYKSNQNNNSSKVNLYGNKVKQKTEQPSGLLFNVELNVHLEKRLMVVCLAELNRPYKLPCNITPTVIPYPCFFWSVPIGGAFPARGRGTEQAKDETSSGKSVDTQKAWPDKVIGSLFSSVF